MDLLRLNWDVALAYCEELAAKLGSYRPQLIVGISRGGLVPARILSDILDVKNVGILGISFYKGAGRHAGSPVISQELTMDLKGKRVLLVDDIADSGRSMAVAKDYVLKLGAKEARTATIHYKPESSSRPDYFVITTTSWVVYPWERHEMERELEKKKK
jgi:hypoxanthine phosphoribosyltransferase